VNELDTPQSCGLHFDLAADQLNVDEINSLLNPRAQKRPWYAQIANSVIGSQSRELPPFYGTGHVSAGKVMLKSVTLSHFTSQLVITPGGFTLEGISADVLGGQCTGELQADFTSGQPTYSSRGRLQKIAIASVAALMKDDWASGTFNASYEGRASGWNADELLSSASGTSAFDWHDGALAHFDLDGQGKALPFKIFTGRVSLKNGGLSIEQGKLQNSGSIYLVSGTASMDRQLELKLAREGTPGYSVSGSLERPVIVAVKSPATQAKLKQSRHP
jgi:hypothetical protein